MISIGRRALRIFVYTLAILIAIIIIAVSALLLAMGGSLPKLDGSADLDGLANAVTLTRDSLGVVTITAATFPDAMRTLGYVHAQERFFEMDLTRRSAAGELSTLLGAATLPIDKLKRRHRLRARMTEHLRSLNDAERALLTQYAKGVNAGLNAHAVRPWQYLILRTEPEPWTPVDSLLVVSEMYSMLQGRDAEARFADAMLRAQIGDKLFAWLKPRGGSFDAPLDGSIIADPVLPTAADLNTRTAKPPAKTAALIDDPELKAGSNNWGIGGALTAHGGGMLANDMHLGHSVPNIWFRAQFMFTNTDGKSPRRVAGATLPGLPALVVGSNGGIAWGFTNTTGKWFDWVPIAAGEKTDEIVETITVKGGEPVSLTVRETRFGPILHDEKLNGTKQSFAFNWTLYRTGAVNTALSALVFTDTVDAAIPLAQRAGMPHQNIVIADRAGNIAWTIAGQLQRYPDWVHHAERGRFTPPEKLADGWLDPREYPLIKNPASARISTANNRLLGGDEAAKMGDGGFDLGARGTQIRDRLLEKQRFTEQDLLAIQRDNESRFLKRWGTLAATVAAQSKQKSVAEMIAKWNGKADADQVGHRLARAYRVAVVDSLWKAWLNAAGANTLAESSLNTQSGASSNYPNWDSRAEYAVWAAVTEQPMHLLPQPHENWPAFLATQLTAVVAELAKQSGTIEQATWGERNRANIIHPFTRALPMLGHWLNMPRDALPGDNNMPLVATPTFGASQRMVVAPGHEEQGIFHMPGGQSGHPFSPFYGAGHGDWVSGQATPLLAGVVVHTLRLAPVKP